MMWKPLSSIVIHLSYCPTLTPLRDKQRTTSYFNATLNLKFKLNENFSNTNEPQGDV